MVTKDFHDDDDDDDDSVQTSQYKMEGLQQIHNILTF